MIMELSLLSATLGLAWPVNSILQCMERGNRLSDGVLELLAANILFGACEIVCFIIGGRSS